MVCIWPQYSLVNDFFAVYNKSQSNQLATLIVYVKDAGFRKVLVCVEPDAIRIIVTLTKENASRLFEVYLFNRYLIIYLISIEFLF